MNYKHKTFSVSMAGAAADQDELDRRWRETFGPKPSGERIAELHSDQVAQSSYSDLRSALNASLTETPPKIPSDISGT